jgi:subtilisin-like proprotein convertase family protein
MKNYTRLTSAILALLLSMALQSSNADPFSIVASDTPLAIPSTGSTGTTVSTVTVPSGSGVVTINDLNIFVDLGHTFTGDLDLIIEHVDTGTTALLFDQHDVLGDDITDVTFDDEGNGGSIASALAPFGPGNFVPIQLLSAFDGESVEGTWTLTVVDNFSGDVGTLYSFRIEGDASPTDSDGDGVEDVADLCPDTTIPETNVPSKGLKPNNFALMDADNVFDTMAPSDGGNGSGTTLTTTHTGGCSCEQILDTSSLGLGHYKFGCSVNIMKRWVDNISN